MAAARIMAAGAALLAAFLITGCGDFMATSGPGERGHAEIRISLDPVGSALGKRAGGNDTLVDLETLSLQLSSAGLTTQNRSINLAGNINGGGITPSAQLFALWGPRNWKLKAWTKDAADSVIHLDSTTFYVDPGDTAALDFTLKPRFSVLIGRFISESPFITAIEKLELRVNNVVVDDTTFSSKKRLFDVVLSTRYLKVGQSATIKLNAMDKATPDRIKYTETVTVTPGQGAETVTTIRLD